jgi:HEPN domain-containing protein
MNEREGPTFPSDWLEIARKDWTRTLHMLDKEDAEAAGFFFQQSLEKYLKAFLLQHGWKLRKIHELDALLDNAAKHNPGLEDFRDLCERVSGYYFANRYPPLGISGLTCEDIKEALEEAKSFVLAMFPGEDLKS